MSAASVEMKQPGALVVACEAAGATAQQGREAYLTWCLAQALGWDQARRRRSRSTWFRHLALLRRVGVAVPVQEHDRAGGALVSGVGLGSDPFAWIGRRFQVEGVLSDGSGCLDLAPGGMVRVDTVLFRDQRWWVLVEGVGPHGSEGLLEEVPVEDFRRCVEPANAA